MAFDPLSDSTRKYRRATIGVASALIIVQTFHVRIEEIPTVGLKIRLAEDLIPVVLTLSLVYFVISFVIHLADDMINYTGGSFVDQYVKESREVIDRASMTFENGLVSMLKRYVDIRDAESIAKELQRFLLVVGADHEQFMAERARHELNPYLDKNVIANEQFEEIARNILAHYRTSRRDAELNMKRSSPLRTYRYFRMVRVYALETAFPLVLSCLAFSARLIPHVTEWLKTTLVPGA